MKIAVASEGNLLADTSDIVKDLQCMMLMKVKG